MSRESKLKIMVTKEGTEYTFFLEGRLDTLTSLDLEDQVDEVLADAEKILFDLGKLDYISSAGLRVLLCVAQEMEDKGEMAVRNLTPVVREIFDITGFSEAFKIE